MKLKKINDKLNNSEETFDYTNIIVSNKIESFEKTYLYDYDGDYFQNLNFLLKDRHRLSKIPINSLETKLETLTKRLFRQAELNELESTGNSDELYQIVMDLKVEPRKITSYPTHLEKYLKPINYNKSIFEKLLEFEKIDKIVLKSRNSYEYVFEYKQKFLSLIEIIKISILFSAYTGVYEITDESIEYQIFKIKQLLGLDNDFMIKMEFIQHGTYDGLFEELVIDKKSDNAKKLLRKIFNGIEYTGEQQSEYKETMLNFYQKKYSKYLNLIVDESDFKDIEQIKSSPHPFCLSCNLIPVSYNIPYTYCCEYCSDKNLDDIDLNLLFGMNWNVVSDDFLLELVDIKKKISKEENILEGTVRIETWLKSYNHAACRGGYHEYDAELYPNNCSGNFVKSYRQSWNTKWKVNMDKNILIINMEPMVIV